MIVSGSDGLFDNIFDQEIISIISESPGVDEAGKFLASTTGVIRPHVPAGLKKEKRPYVPALLKPC